MRRETLLVDGSHLGGRALDAALVLHAFEPIGRPIRQAFFVGMDEVKRDRFPSRDVETTAARRTRLRDLPSGNRLTKSSTPRRRDCSNSSRSAAAIRTFGPGHERLDDFVDLGHVQRGRARWEHFAQALIEHGHTDLILPAIDHVGQSGGQILGIMELRSVAACGVAKAHRAAGVQREGAQQIGFFFVDADERLAGSAEDFPVETPEVFAAGVFAEVDELARPALLTRGVATAVRSPRSGGAW